jgi:hypothetical protein
MAKLAGWEILCSTFRTRTHEIPPKRMIAGYYFISQDTYPVQLPENMI